MSFDEYWADSRFHRKRPDMHASVKKAFGDNIYHRENEASEWRQLDSHHSYQDGTQNDRNVRNDTQVNRVLISDDFIYWGGSGPLLPPFRGETVCHSTQAHRCNFPARWLRTSLPGFVASTTAATAASRWNGSDHLGVSISCPSLKPRFGDVLAHAVKPAGGHLSSGLRSGRRTTTLFRFSPE